MADTPIIPNASFFGYGTQNTLSNLTKSSNTDIVDITLESILGAPVILFSGDVSCSLIPSSTFNLSGSIVIYNIDVDNTVYNGQVNVEINGANFGTTPGTVDFDGVFQTSLTWTNTKITIPVANTTGLELGTHTLRVRRG